MSWILPVICTSQIQSRLCAHTNHLSFYFFQSQDFRKLTLTLQRGSGALGLNIMGGYTVSIWNNFYVLHFKHVCMIEFTLVSTVVDCCHFYGDNTECQIILLSFLTTSIYYDYKIIIIPIYEEKRSQICTELKLLKVISNLFSA